MDSVGNAVDFGRSYHDGSHYTQECAFCTHAGILRCHECSPARLLCAECDKTVHMLQPLHDRQMWTGKYFQFIPPSVRLSDLDEVTEIGTSF